MSLLSLLRLATPQTDGPAACLVIGIAHPPILFPSDSNFGRLPEEQANFVLELSLQAHFFFASVYGQTLPFEYEASSRCLSVQLHGVRHTFCADINHPSDFLICAALSDWSLSRFTGSTGLNLVEALMLPASNQSLCAQPSLADTVDAYFARWNRFNDDRLHPPLAFH